jgi:hypothetical protein
MYPNALDITYLLWTAPKCSPKLIDALEQQTQAVIFVEMKQGRSERTQPQFPNRQIRGEIIP